jgi:multidrug efflux pump subunit AcrB
LSAESCAPTSKLGGGEVASTLPPKTFFGRLHHRIEWFLDHLTRFYGGLLAVALRNRFKVLIVVGLIFMASLSLVFFIGREFFPQVDAGQITMYIHAPSNLRLDANEQRIVEVEEYIRGVIPKVEREKIVSEMGVDPDWSSAYTANSGQEDAVVRIQLSEKRTKSAREYAELLRTAFQNKEEDEKEFEKEVPGRKVGVAEFRKYKQDFSDLRVSFNTGGMVATALNNGAASPIDIQIEGGQPEKQLEIARQVRNRLRDIKGVADARVLQRLDAPYLKIDVNREKAASVGLSPREVILQVVSALNSSTSIERNFWIDTASGNQYFVAVQYPDYPDMKVDDVLNIEATGTNQSSPVKLSSVASFHRVHGAVEINHVNLTPVFNVQVNTQGRDIASVATDVGRAIKDIERRLPEGMFIKFKGEFERMNESFWNLLFGLALAAVLVYLLQVALFRSWVGPFIIMFTVPLGLIGVLTTLWLTNTTLNVQSQMGVIFLVGIAVNNGVLLVEFANKQLKQGLSLHQAITRAAAIRFRPIIMTFLATFLDLIPMAIGMGRGSEANIALARAVVGGLLTSTCLTLFVVPILYTLLLREGGGQEVDIEAELAETSPGLDSRDGQEPQPSLTPP